MTQLTDYLELRRLTEGSGFLYNLANESYNDIYNNVMSKGKIKLKSSFLGGNPVTLERKDFSTLVDKEYVVSTKADGMRFLLMIGNKTEFAERRIFFVDRNKDFWMLVNNGQELPPISNIPNCLIDGEMLMWGNLSQNKDVIRLTRSNTIKPLMVFSAFDILYGPTNPEFEGEYTNLKLNLGSSGAFMGRKGGYRWPWKKRYSILSTLLTNELSTLRNYDSEMYRFRMVVSPFMELKTVLSSKNPYIYMKNVFDEGLRYQFPEIPKRLGSKTDGLILTPANTEYLKDSWTFCGNDQFKWKPSNELTVDLQVGKQTSLEIEVDDETKKIRVFKAYARRGNKGVLIGYLLPPEDSKIKSKIVECLWNKEHQNLFEYVSDRPDKLVPNAEKTVHSVVNAISNPISIKALQIVYKYGISNLMKMENNNNSEVKQVLKQLTNSFKLRCILKDDPTVLFTKKELIDIKKMIELAQTTENSELESRIFFPKQTRTLSYFNCLVSKLKEVDTPTNPTIKQYGPNGIRRSSVILGDHLVKEEQIRKSEIKRIKFKKSKVMDISKYNISHIDTVLSTETELKGNPFVKNKGYSYRYQVRYEVNPAPFGKTPSVLWRVDVTEFGTSKKSWEDAKKNYETKPQSSIELEYAPGDQENSVWRYFEDNPTKQNLLNVIDIFQLGNIDLKPHIVKKALDNRVLKLKKVDSDFIIKDYCRLLVWVLNLIYD